jgi:hypothetical protein
MMEPGERVQMAYRSAFKHRYGGNAPSWQAISDQERALWAQVEESLREQGRQQILGPDDGRLA